MDELTAGENGWFVQAGRRDALERMPAKRWATPQIISYELDEDPAFSAAMVERHRICGFRLL